MPGGPSDKAGNRYELDWVVRRLVDLVIGRVDWLRIEPPGEHAIEFRCLAAGRHEAHQVKRGVSGGGHWTIPALNDVLVGFRTILLAEADVSCVFVSEHAAPELNELTERARGSENLAEFTERFLAAQSVSRSWDQLSTVWQTSPDETRRLLQRVEVTAVGAGRLRDDTNAILQLVFSGNPDLVRAALADLALGSVHRRLLSGDVLRHLLGRGIHRFEMGRVDTIAPLTSPPPSTGTTRVRELSEISDLLGAGTTTVHIGGITGIGKTTVAVQFASGWKGPVCWIDCDLLTSELEALSAIGEFIAQSLGVDSVAAALARGRSSPASMAQLAGKCLAARQCLIVWDGADGQVARALVPLIDSIASTLEGGGQIVTAQVRPETGRALLWGTVHVDRLDRAAVRRLLVEAQPDAGVTDLESADEFTQGHPYLVQLLVAALRTVDLRTALGLVKVDGGSDALLTSLLAELPGSAVTLLRSAAWLEVPFAASQVSRLGGTPELIRGCQAVTVGTDAGVAGWMV